MLRIKALVFAALAAAVSPLYAQETERANPVELRAREFAKAVSSHDPEQLRVLVAESFDEQMQKIPFGLHLWLLTSYWDMSHGLTFSGLDDAKPYEAIVRFGNALTRGTSGIFIRVDPEPPHRIVAVNAQLLGTPEPAPEHPGNERIASEIDSFVQRLVAADVFSGVVLVADRTGNVVFAHAYGQADKIVGLPNTLDTKFNLASMNKMFTAVAIAQLVERGKLSYDDPLSRFIDFPNAEIAKTITVRHLISHSSGFSMWYAPRDPKSPPVDFKSVDELIALISPDERPQFPPGTGFQYSNTGFLLLGKVIEVASGMSYSDYVRKNLYDPAGMTSTTEIPRRDLKPPLAIGYRKWWDEHGAVQFTATVPADNGSIGTPMGGGQSTAADLEKFARALRAGVLLERAHVGELFEGRGAVLPSQQYGYGFIVDEDAHIVGHSGGTYGVSNNVDMFLRSGWTSVVLANYTEDTFEVSRSVVEKIRSLVPNE